MTDKPTVDSLPLTNVKFLKPSCKFNFHNGTEVVGTFDFNGPKMVFSGDADESVAVFVKALSHWFEGRLKQEREAEREACAKVCDNIAACHEQQDSNIGAGAAKDCAEIIRAKSET